MHEERDFEDGEHKVRPLDSVRGADVYVIQSLSGDATQSTNDKLCRLLFFIGALKDAGAARVTAVTPYLCYARKDRRTKVNDPVTTRYVAELFEAVGTDAVMTLDVHNPAAFENAEKHRSAGVVSGDLFVGTTDRATALVVDDLVSTGTTLLRAARSARKHGAERVIAFVTHGLFMPGAADVIADPAIDRLVVTDSTPLLRMPAGHLQCKIDVLPAASLIAEAIRRLHDESPLAGLLVF
jgi:ribose-phosphate pyrophosphokinase